MALRLGDRAEAGDILGGLRPFVLHDDHHPEAELGHHLGRFRADGRRIEASFRMRHRPRPDRRAGDVVEFPVIFETLLRQRQAHDLGRFHEAPARLLHRDAEARVFHARRAAAEAEQAAPAAQHIEQRDLLGDPDRIVPRQHDHRGAQRDPLRPSGEIGQQLRRRRRHRIAGEMMLQREERIEAERLGQIAERQMLPIHRSVRPSRLGKDTQRQPDLHPSSPFSGRTQATAGITSRANNSTERRLAASGKSPNAKRHSR